MPFTLNDEFYKYLQSHIQGTTLDLSQENIDPRDLRVVIDFLKENPGIESLNLSGNALGDVPQALLTLPTILEIDLSDILNPIKGQETLPDHIFVDLGNTNMTTIKLNNNNVTDNQLADVLKNDSLLNLELENNSLSQSGEQMIKEFQVKHNRDLGHKFG